MQQRTGFLLTRDWRDQRSGHRQIYWAASDQGALQIIVDNQRPLCFVATTTPGTPDIAERRPLKMKNPEQQSVDALYFRQQRQLQHWRQQAGENGIELFESDVKPCERFLMERFITAAIEIRGEFQDQHGFTRVCGAQLRPATYKPDLRWLSLDIETSDIMGELYSIAVVADKVERVFMRGPGETTNTVANLSYHDDEKALLLAFFHWFADFDPDLIIGWHVVNFDLDFLARKCQQFKLAFNIGRAGETASLLPGQTDKQTKLARIPGRVVLDGIECLRSAFITFEDYSLEHVARALLGEGKLITGDGGKVSKIQRLFQQDKPALAEYNLQDCRLVAQIFKQCALIDFALERAQLTGLALGRFGGSVAAFDHLYLPQLHRKGLVAPDLRPDQSGLSSPGGYVLESRPGIYRNVIVLDFKSLYPGIIRTFKVDPYGLMIGGANSVPGFLGAEFCREDSILPGLIGELWQARDEAKAMNNAALSQAIKIIMNSFYGVLGSNGCRFFNPKLASSITKRGHEIITRSREFIEEQGFQVIYGDTDSLFVWLQDEKTEQDCLNLGQTLQRQLNHWWQQRLQQDYQLESYLEVEFETLYLRFLMPKIRGLEKGSKKRYAGLVRQADGSSACIFKGLESVRSDWTPMARQVQRHLYECVFREQPYEDYLLQIKNRLFAGELDEQLVYRKRLRRQLADYQKNIPPHVQAARQLDQVGRYVQYVITLNGPEPVEKQKSRLDYRHYEEKQLKPVVDGLLNFLDQSYEQICGAQMALFK